MESFDSQRIMKIISALLVLILFVPLNAQWASFNLNKVDAENFSQEVGPFLQSISLSTISHFNTITENDKRLTLGVAYSHGVNVSGEETSSKLMGGYPNFFGGFIISENLQLKGNFSIFNSGDEIIQSFAYGLGLNLTNKESSNWKASVLFSQMQGPDDIRLKSFDGNITYNFWLVTVPVYIGFGINSYKAKILLDDDSIPNSIKGNANHLLVGSQLTTRQFTISPLIKLSSDVIVMAVEFSGSFR